MSPTIRWPEPELLTEAALAQRPTSWLIYQIARMPTANLFGNAKSNAETILEEIDRRIPPRAVAP